MSTIELKDILIHQIGGINDKSFLASIKTMIDERSVSAVYQTSMEQKQEIEEGLEQLRQGKSVSDKQVETKMDQWLQER
jgi:predicted transcriptional regulator